MDNQTTAATSTEPTTLNTNHWQRIAPIAMLYFVVKFFIGIAGNFVYLAPAIILGYKEFLANPHFWLPISLLLLTIIAISTFLSFYFFQYRLTDQQIEIRSGVISKKYVNLPFSRIQNVKLEQPIYYRPFHYTCLQLDTAGSNKQEAKIVALNVAMAEQLKHEILTFHHQQLEHNADGNEQSDQTNITEQSGQVKPAINEVVLNTRSLFDLVLHGLTNNRIWIFLGGLAPFFDNIANAVNSFLLQYNIDLGKLLFIADKSWWQIGLFALSLTFIVMLVISLFSVAGSIISFYRYSLSKVGDRYIRRSGLFTKHEVSMPLSRLQMVVKQQDWLDLLLKRINVKLEQSNAHGQNYQAHASNNKIIVPSVKADECQQLLADIYPENQLNTIHYNTISKRFLLRNIGYILLPSYLILGSLLLLQQQMQLAGWALIIFLFTSILIYCRWRRWGFACDNNFIYIRKGLLGVDHYCFPLYKVQQTQFQQSWFQQRNQLCTIKLILAAGGQKIPFICQQQGQDLIDQILYQVESSKRSWM